MTPVHHNMVHMAYKYVTTCHLTDMTIVRYRKMSDTSQQFAETVFGSANVLHKPHQSDLSQRINAISPDNVFHTSSTSSTSINTISNGKPMASRPSGQKRVFHSPIGMLSRTASSVSASNGATGNGSTGNGSTLISIGGKVFSTNKLKPIQLLSAKSSTSFVPLKQHQQQPAHNHHSHQQQQYQPQPSDSSKYILIASSQIESTTVSSHRKSSSSSSSQNGHLISITGSGTLHSLLPRGTDGAGSVVPVILSGDQLDNSRCKSRCQQQQQQQPAVSSPLSVSETCEFALDEPSQLDSSSTELGPLSPSLRFSQSLQQEDDDLDLEMDQFLDSYSILDQPHDIDSNPDLYKEDVDDYCVWQDESFGLQDVEIEIH